MKDKNKSIISLVVTLLMVLIIVAAFAYAYFSSDIVKNRKSFVNVNVSRIKTPFFSSVPDDDTLYLEVDSALMDRSFASADNKTVVATENQNITVSLIGGSTLQTVTCDFDFVWYDLSSDFGVDMVVPYKRATGVPVEFTMELKKNNNTILSEKDMNTIYKQNTIGSYSITSNGLLVEDIYQVIIRFYNTNYNQTTANKAYVGVIKTEHVICREDS